MITKLNLEHIIDRSWNIISTSAVTLEGLKDLFGWVYEQATGGKDPQIYFEKKIEGLFSFHSPCPMMRKLDGGTTFCLNQDGFTETELIGFGFEEKVNRMLLGILPELRKESLEHSGKDICPDFCFLKPGEKILRCPVTDEQIKTRGIIVDLKRYEDAYALTQIYGARFGQDLCRECFYKIIISPDCLLSEREIKELFGLDF